MPPRSDRSGSSAAPLLAHRRADVAPDRGRRTRFGAPDEASAHSLLDGALELFCRHRRIARQITKRAYWCRHKQRVNFSGVRRRYGTFVQRAWLRRALAELRRYRQVNLRRDKLCEGVKGECGLMRDDCLRLVVSIPTPEAKTQQIVVLGARKCRNAV